MNRSSIKSVNVIFPEIARFFHQNTHCTSIKLEYPNYYTDYKRIRRIDAKEYSLPWSQSKQ